MFRGLWRMPKDHPAWASITTGLVALILLGNAVVSAYKLSQGMTPNGSIQEPILYVLGGVLLLALTIYAAYGTDWFRNWGTPGKLGHPVVRWIGPLVLILVLIEIIVLLLFVGAALGGSNEKK